MSCFALLSIVFSKIEFEEGEDFFLTRWRPPWTRNADSTLQKLLDSLENVKMRGIYIASNGATKSLLGQSANGIYLTQEINQDTDICMTNVFVVLLEAKESASIALLWHLDKICEAHAIRLSRQILLTLEIVLGTPGTNLQFWMKSCCSKSLTGNIQLALDDTWGKNDTPENFQLCQQDTIFLKTFDLNPSLRRVLRYLNTCFDMPIEFLDSQQQGGIYIPVCAAAFVSDQLIEHDALHRSNALAAWKLVCSVRAINRAQYDPTDEFPLDVKHNSKFTIQIINQYSKHRFGSTYVFHRTATTSTGAVASLFLKTVGRNIKQRTQQEFVAAICYEDACLCFLFQVSCPTSLVQSDASWIAMGLGRLNAIANLAMLKSNFDVLERLGHSSIAGALLERKNTHRAISGAAAFAAASATRSTFTSTIETLNRNANHVGHPDVVRSGNNNAGVLSATLRETADDMHGRPVALTTSSAHDGLSETKLKTPFQALGNDDDLSHNITINVRKLMSLTHRPVCSLGLNTKMKQVSQYRSTGEFEEATNKLSDIASDASTSSQSLFLPGIGQISRTLIGWSNSNDTFVDRYTTLLSCDRSLDYTTVYQPIDPKSAAARLHN